MTYQLFCIVYAAVIVMIHVTLSMIKKYYEKRKSEVQYSTKEYWKYDSAVERVDGYQAFSLMVIVIMVPLLIIMAIFPK